MTDEQSQNGEGATLHQELVDLRRRGLTNRRKRRRKALELPELTAIANAICPDVVGKDERLASALQAAAGRLDPKRSAAICDLWGLTDATTGKPLAVRRQRAMDHMSEPSESSFLRDVQPALTDDLEAQLWLLYEEGQTADKESGESSEDFNEAVADDASQGKSVGVDGVATAEEPQPRHIDFFQPEVATAEPETPVDTSAKPRGHRRLLARLATSVVIALVFGLTLDVAGVDVPLISTESTPPVKSEQPSVLPPPDSVVNARTGKVETAAALDRDSPEGAHVEGGSILRVCNLPSDYPCFLEGLQPPIPAREGDTIEFRVRLYNPTAKALLRVNVGILWHRSDRHPNQMFVSAFVGWNTPGELNPTKGSNLTKLLFPTRVNKLTYIHGSTQLLDANGNLVGRLPNGIIVRKGHAGLWLTELGPPDSCPTCNPAKFKRYISFKAEVT